MDQDPIVIVAGARTPMGAFQGELSSMAAHQLGSVAIGAALERANVKPEQVDEVIMGCVLPAGQGQAPARQAALGRGSAGRGRLHHRQQDVRLGHARRDVRVRRAEGRQLRRHRRRRHGVDDQRAVPADEGARRLSHGAGRDLRPHDDGRSRGRVRDRARAAHAPFDGHVRRGLRDALPRSRARSRTTSRRRRSSGRRPPRPTARSTPRSRR